MVATVEVAATVVAADEVDASADADPVATVAALVAWFGLCAGVEAALVLDAVVALAVTVDETPEAGEAVLGATVDAVAVVVGTNCELGGTNCVGSTVGLTELTTCGSCVAAEASHSPHSQHGVDEVRVVPAVGVGVT